MAKIEIYTAPQCFYCTRAKALLDRKGAAYTEYNIGSEPARRAEMTARSGGKLTVPQIFIDDKNIGGSDDLTALERSGQLDSLLGQTA